MALPPDHPSTPPVPPRGDGSRSSLSFVLSGVMLAIYIGFVLLVAYEKPFLSTQIVPGLSWGILLGALVIVSAWLLTLVYVLATNKREGV